MRLLRLLESPAGRATSALLAIWLATAAPARHIPTAEIAMKTQGEIEAAICEGIARFELEYLGRGPKDVHTHVLGDLIVVRLQGVLTAAEQHLAASQPPEKGRDLLKQVRSQLIETARSAVDALIAEVTGKQVLSLHHDVSTATGEEIVVLTLAEPPYFRNGKKR